jgi:hypothetical protein
MVAVKPSARTRGGSQDRSVAPLAGYRCAVAFGVAHVSRLPRVLYEVLPATKPVAVREPSVHRLLKRLSPQRSPGLTSAWCSHVNHGGAHPRSHAGNHCIRIAARSSASATWAPAPRPERQCALTLRSSRDLHRHGTWPAKRSWPMLRLAGQAPCRFRPLSSNVRPHRETLCQSATQGRPC